MFLVILAVTMLVIALVPGAIFAYLLNKLPVGRRWLVFPAAGLAVLSTFLVSLLVQPSQLVTASPREHAFNVMLMAPFVFTTTLLQISWLRKWQRPPRFFLFACLMWFLVAGTLAVWLHAIRGTFFLAIAAFGLSPSNVLSCLATVSFFAAVERATCYVQIKWRLTALLALDLIVLTTAVCVALNLKSPRDYLVEQFICPSIAVAAVYMLRSVLRNSRRDAVNAHE
jgi:hypothetical protein